MNSAAVARFVDNDHEDEPETKIIHIGSADAGNGACFVIKNKQMAIALDCGAESDEINPIEAKRNNKQLVEKLLEHKVTEIVITHFHFDHFGSLGNYLKELKKINANWPTIVCSYTTWKFLYSHLRKNKVFDKSVLSPYFNIKHAIGTKHVRLFDALHSVPGSCAALVTANDRNIFYTGDFININLPDDLPEIDDLIIDSTRCEKSGFEDLGHEKRVRENLVNIIAGIRGRSRSTNIFLAMFSSQLERAGALYAAFSEMGERVSIKGASLANNLSLYDVNMEFSAKSRISLITGVWAQGWESPMLSTLVKLALDQKETEKLTQGDVVILSGSIPNWSPEVAKNIKAMIDKITEKGVTVMVDDTAPEEWDDRKRVFRGDLHASGHGLLGDALVVVEKLNPRQNIIPTHGSESARKNLAMHCRKLGYKMEE